jgi:outer membrane receptor protein involved in Fe transport
MMALVLTAALALFSPRVLHGQDAAGKIHFEVKDPSGLAMKAAGTLQGVSNGVNRTFQTDAQGMYEVDNLPNGRYRVEISKDGFATQSLVIDVQPGAPVSRAITLTLTPQATRVEVVAATPLSGTNLPLDEVPAPVQTATSRDIDQSGALDLSDLLNRRLSGVNLNENQENPFQPDLNYRGYTASPLLGTPQGVSVYMDGVRQTNHLAT